eukprot:bmy_17794T0
MNENLFAPFVTPTIIGLSVVILIIIFPNLITNTNITRSIYWVNQPSWTTAPLIYTHHAALSECGNSHPPMSRYRGYRSPQQNKSISSSLPTTRHAHPPHPHASNYRNYQPIHPTSSTSCETNGQYYSRSFINTSNRRNNLSANKHQHIHSSHYVHYSHPIHYPRIRRCYNSSLCVYPLTFYHSSLSPIPELGGCWPPTGIRPLNPLEVLLLNTSVLLATGMSITWAHHSLMEGNHKHRLQALFITITLGVYILHSYKPQSITKPHLRSQMGSMDRLSLWPQDSTDYM